MNLAEIFNNPFDPNKSIQLNNKYWPSENYTILNLLEDCEASISEMGINQKSVPMKQLKRVFQSDIYYQKMLRRLGKILCFQSDFGYQLKNIPISNQLLEAIKYSGDRDMSSMPLPSTQELNELSKKAQKIYHDEYGWDISIVHKSVRFARPSEVTTQLVTRFGPMSEYHNDELKGITCVVYLSEVKEENGAFSFIEGSERISRSSVLSAIHQTVCFDMGFANWEQMESLPLEFRCTPLIGNFIEPEKVDVLLQKKIVLEGNPGQAIIFNGQKIIHRGGKPISGSRYAAFLATEGIVTHKIRSLLSQIQH